MANIEVSFNAPPPGVLIADGMNAFEVGVGPEEFLVEPGGGQIGDRVDVIVDVEVGCPSGGVKHGIEAFGIVVEAGEAQDLERVVEG
jgi:hypothetical protein